MKKQQKRKPKKIPAGSNPVTARQWAFFFVEQWRSKDKLVRDQLIAAGSDRSEQHQGAKYAERLILRIGIIDIVLAECVSRPRDRVELTLWTLLQLGAAELLFGPVKSHHAAISETVELCRFAGHPEWTGFLNGVLRGVQRLLDDETHDEAEANRYPAADREYRSLKKKIFPNPNRRLRDYLSHAFSLPGFLISQWEKTFSQEELFEIAWASLVPPPMTVRISRMLIEPEKWIAKCEEQDIKVEAGDYPEAVRLKQSLRLSDLPGFHEGEFVIQDETAMHAVRLLNPYPKQNVLDLCAGPGTKTTQLAELMLNQGNIVAAEVVEHRLKQVRENAERLGYECIETLLIDRHEPEIDGGPFDAILVDAPCSNTGVLGKRVEARWRYCDNEVRELNEIQLHLVDVAARELEQDGRIVYSTCSIDSRENEQLIQTWLELHPEFICSEMKTILPNATHDGGFSALLFRKDSAEDKQTTDAPSS